MTRQLPLGLGISSRTLARVWRSTQRLCMSGVSVVASTLPRWTLWAKMIGLLISSRRRQTRYWRDWSSDVCSSDLDGHRLADALHLRGQGLVRVREFLERPAWDLDHAVVDRGLEAGAGVQLVVFSDAASPAR